MKGRTTSSLLAAAFLSAVGVATGTADAQDPLVAAARATMNGIETRGEWRNSMMLDATGRDEPRSADLRMAGLVSSYTRDVFDRGGWMNPYVDAPGYDVGNVLFVVRPGDGVTDGGAMCRRGTALC